MMAKNRRARFSYAEERRLIQMAATSATLEEAAAKFKTSVGTIERKAEKLGILGADRKRLSARFVLKAKGIDADAASAAPTSSPIGSQDQKG
jgi:hypothetical protein